MEKGQNSVHADHLDGKKPNMSDQNRIKLVISPDGTIQLDAPAESFEAAVEKTRELVQSLDVKVGQMQPSTANTAGANASQTAQTASHSKANKATRQKGGKAPSSARTGRIGSFEEVKGLLSEPQEIELRKFFEEKKPKEQQHEVLVAMYKGEELLNRKGFQYNDIYTLMWLAGVKELPKALDQVLRTMIAEQYITKEETGFVVKFLGRQFIETKLPPLGE